MRAPLRLAEGYVEVKALGWTGVVYALGWN